MSYIVKDKSVSADRQWRMPKLLRWILLGCGGVVSFYIGNVAWDIITSWSKLNELPDNKKWEGILEAIIGPSGLDWLHLPEWSLLPIVIFIWCIFLAFLYASYDVRRERKEKRAEEYRKLLIEDELRKIMERFISTSQVSTINASTPDVQEEPSKDFSLFYQPAPTVVRKNAYQWLLNNLYAGRGKVLVLYGLPGMGKMTLVSASVMQLDASGRFRDGIVVHDCKEETQPREILQKILSKFDPQRSLPDINRLDDTARRLLSKKDALVVLLNVEMQLSVREVVAPLCASGATVLLTSNYRPTHLPTNIEYTYHLRELPEEEATELFLLTINRKRENLSTEEMKAIGEIIRRLGYYPLAVKMVGTYSIHRDLETLAHDLRQNPKRELIFTSSDMPDPVVLAFSECTTGLQNDTRRLFSALSAFPTIEFSRKAAIALGESLGIAKAETHVDTLQLRLLIEPFNNKRVPVECDRERLRIHPLLHAFAEKEFASWPPQEQDNAKLAIASYYADYTSRTFDKFPDFVLTADENNIIQSLEWAHERGESQLEVTIAFGMQDYLFNQKRKTASLILPRGKTAAETIAATTNESEDFLRVASLALTQGRIQHQEGKIDEAIKIFEESLQLRRTLKDRKGEAVVLVHLGQIEQQRGRLTEADRYYQESMQIALSLPDQQIEGILLGYQGELAWQRGRAEAARYYSDSLERLSQAHTLADKRNRAQALLRLGTLMQEYKQPKEAYNYYLKGWELAKEIQDQQSEAWFLGYLGTLALERRKWTEAENHFNQALSIAGEMRNRFAESWLLECLGRLALAHRKLDEADTHFREALTIARETQDRRRECCLLALLGDLAQARKQERQAEQAYRESLGIARDVDHIRYAHTAVAFALFLAKRRSSSRDEYCKLLTEAEQLFTQAALPDAKQTRKLRRQLKCAD
jgi:tetratricopeptide (TPR) repeat protein